MRSDGILLAVLLHISYLTITFCIPHDQSSIVRSGENSNSMPIWRLNDRNARDGEVNGQSSFLDVFNQRVVDKNNLCPRSQMVLFLLTRNIEVLRNCSAINTNSAGTMSTTNDFASGNTAAISYSGRLLKRILQNLNEDIVKINILPSTEDQPEKRSRLSLNGALSSLSDMLYYGDGRRQPMNAFHRGLLRMG